MFFGQEKLNPNNENYLVKAIGLMLYYEIYSFTTLFIANLIYLADLPTPELIIYHLEQNLTASCFLCWSTALTKRKLPVQCTISMEVCTEEAWKPSLQIIALPGGSVAYRSYISSSFLNNCYLFFLILVTRMKQLDYCKIVQENFNFVVQDILART